MYLGPVFGYHGCPAMVAHKVLNGEVEHLFLSDSKAEWLGKGVYFWENNYTRAMQWAEKHVKDDTPAVIGAIISPGTCLDLTDAGCLDGLSIVAETFEGAYMKKYGRLPTKNRAGYHPYDCALINHYRECWEISNPGRRINTVRGAFTEGRTIAGSSFATQNHIQWAVITPEESIIGYFRPTQAMMQARTIGL